MTGFSFMTSNQVPVDLSDLKQPEDSVGKRNLYIGTSCPFESNSNR